MSSIHPVIIVAQMRACVQKYLGNLKYSKTPTSFYKNIFSLIAIAGVLFETGGLWLKHERHIRIVSFFGAPCWLAYNLVSSAYGSAIGNIMTMLSILIAIVRYDILHRSKPESETKSKTGAV